MEKIKNEAAVALGRLGGSVSSEAKKRAAKEREARKALQRLSTVTQ